MPAAAAKSSGDDPTLDNLAAARKSLRAGLEKSQSLAEALSAAGPRLNEIHRRLPYLESSVRPILARRESLAAAAAHIDRAVGPAAAVLKVFDAVHGLEKPLSSLSGDLNGYLTLLSRLEQALKFLSDNSSLALSWLEDIIDYLSDQSLADPKYLQALKQSLITMKNSKVPLDGGLLSSALNKLDSEFRRLLSESSSPLLFEQLETSPATPTLTPPPLPASVIQKLLPILDRMIANGRLDWCVSAYTEIRGLNIQASLGSLGLEYLQIRSDEVQAVEEFISLWRKHVEFAVRCLFDSERKLCAEVFDRAPPGTADSCFADLVADAGMPVFLQFAASVTECKKDPIKLLKLLDIFATLQKLRPDFNRLFGGKACVEIQNLTRDLIKRVIGGACEIFWELLVQVELQRPMPPPPAGVPRLVSFITDYCNKLIGDEYGPVLTQVLVIHRSWKQEKLQKRLLADAILNIVRALELNFEQWSKGYDDVVQGYLFMMNTHWHFYKTMRGTKLGDLLGEARVREHEQYKEYYATVFMRDSWGKLPSLLSKEGLVLFSGGRATARDLVKKRLKAFNEAFDVMYQKQLNWVITDRELRDKTTKQLVTAIVPAYKSFIQLYGPLVEQVGSSRKYAKYSADVLEKILGSLFQHKPTRAQSFNLRHSSGKISSPLTSQYHTAPTVA